MSDLTPPHPGFAENPATGMPPVTNGYPPYAPPPVPKRSRGRVVLIVVITVVVAIVVAALVRWGISAAFAGPSKQDVINTSVAQIKKDSGLPKKVDAVTTWTDVKPESDAIHYEYTVSADVDPSSLSEAAIRKSLLPTLCATSATRRILDEDIAMRYSYTFDGSAKTIDTTFTKADC